MASFHAPIDAGAARQLGLLLTGSEARELADRLADGDTLTTALRVVAAARRPEARLLLEAVDPGSPARSQLVAVLRAVEGARSTPTALDPLWTMPGHLAQGGPLTSSVTHLVDNARQSVTCSTFNFQRSSGLWTALQQAAQRPEITIRLYLDTAAADQQRKPWSPTTAEVAAHLRSATIMRMKKFDGSRVRNHAKFLAIDHRFLLVTSANFSWSAEYGNVEFGVLVDNRNLTEAVEREMLQAEDLLFEHVPVGPTAG
ncbi:MAG TPA: DISARM system phospholipase D-like protein DrmC [Streptosporangiaceae bacterium]|nr:DISARM system phospholipase D-like protein DrmC [Streptosporangiaceae bacterium]